MYFSHFVGYRIILLFGSQQTNIQINYYLREQDLLMLSQGLFYNDQVFFPYTEENFMLRCNSQLRGDTLPVCHQPLQWCWFDSSREDSPGFPGRLLDLLQGGKVTASVWTGTEAGLPTGQDGWELLGVREVLSSATPPAPIPRSQHKCLNPLGDDSWKWSSAWNQREGKPRVRAEGWNCNA